MEKMIAIIPARWGSKGLPGKNIKELNGLPLIGYSIREARKSNYISDVIVSTDSNEIAEIATDLGANVPFLRPAELGQDTSKAIDAFIYTIERLEKEFGYDIENFIVLQPTSPLRTSEDIDGAIRKFHDLDADSVISVTEAPYPPHWAKRITKDGVLEGYFKDKISTKNRQELEQAYLPNGAIFIFKAHKLIDEYKYYFDKTFAYVMSQERSVDIDTELDFKIAAYLMKQMEMLKSR